MKKSIIKCYSYMADAYNDMRAKLNTQIQQIQVSSDEIETSMRATGAFTSTYDIGENRYTIHQQLANELNISEVYTEMPNDFLNAIMPLMDEEDNNKAQSFFSQILNGIPSGEIEIKLKAKNNSYEYMRCSYRSVAHEDNKPTSAIITVANITAEKNQKIFYDEYTMSIEKRALNKNGTFILIDVTNQKLLNFTQYGDQESQKNTADTLEELCELFDKFELRTNNHDKFIDVYNKEKLMQQFELGNLQSITYWRGKIPNGTAYQVEMIAFLVANPTTGNIELAMQLYVKGKADEIKSSEDKTILFIQTPSQQRDILVDALKTSFGLTVADTCSDAKLLFEMKNEYSIIIFDLSTEKENPFEFIREIKEICGNTPFLAITDGSIPQSVKAIEEGVADIQSMPINTTLIKHRINSILSKQDALLTVRNDADHRDEITGLHRKGAFITLAKEIIGNAAENEKFVLMCMDIADFRTIHTRFGNERGDEILRTIGDAINSVIKGTIGVAMIARADWFYVMVPNDSCLIDEIISRITTLNFGLPVDVFVRIGIYHVEVNETIESMMNKVLLAINSIRNNPSQKVVVYNQNMLEAFAFNQRIKVDFENAMKMNQIVPYYQPKYDYENGYYIGSEALARWIHPELGFLQSDKFISVLENEGLISELDLYILEKVCHHQRKWKDRGVPTLPVSVNLSQVDFTEPSLSEKVLSIIEKYNLSGEDIRFEITETSYVNDPSVLVEFIDAVHKKGFFVEMDDFGTGYSSLQMLDEINFDALKLDMKMTNSINNKGEHILGAIIRMAGWLKMDVVAEGVETENQANYLYNLGCTYMQGYYFSKPLPAPAYKELLKGKKVKVYNNKSTQIVEKGVSLEKPSTFDANDIGAFLTNIRDIFFYITSQNYTQNRYYIMECDNFEYNTAAPNGIYDDLISSIIPKLHPDDRQMFAVTYSRDNILSLFEEGQTKFNHVCRHMGGDGEYHWIRTKVLVYRDSSGDVRGYTLTRNVDDEYKSRSNSERYKNVISGMSKAFVLVFEIDIQKGLMKTIHMPEEQQEYITPISNFESSLQKWAEKDMNPEEFEKYQYFWDFSDITERINTNTNTSIVFNSNSIGWQMASLVDLERDNNGKVTKVLWFSQNIDEKVKQEKKTEDVKDAFVESYDMAYQIDIDINKCYEIKRNEKVRAIVSQVGDVGEIIHTFITHGVDPGYQAFMYDFVNLETLNQRLEGKKRISAEFEGQLCGWIRADIVPITYSEDGKLKQFIFGVNMIGKEKLAELDSMTGLLNSGTSQKQIEKMLKSGDVKGGALLIVDMDELKTINDTKGHQAGTDAIVGVADCIKNKFRSTDIIGRYGGDEFIVFLKGYEDREKQLKEKVQSLLTDIATSEFIEGCTVTCTIGIALVDDEATSFKKLFGRADYALYNAKKNGKNTFVLYSE
ncbi:MAG: EAL domain-containing protein [Eubacteriales bacterium]|nr:EAL domain-containing protein [Eubacteriales bacterium]